MTPKRTRSVLFGLALAVVLALPAPSQPPVLTILHFNDVYQLTAVDGGRRGGFDRLATVVKRHRAQERPSLLLFAGDLISPSVESSIFKGAQLIDGMNHLGVDAATFGNHEFDYGPEELAKRVRESRFPWVVSNVFAPGLRPFPGVKPWLVLSPGGVPVGIVGLLTEDTAVLSSPGNTTFGNVFTVTREVVRILRARGARVIVALTHLSMAQDQQLLREVPEVDLVIGGHEHDPLTATVGGRLVAKAGSDAKWLGVTLLSLDGSRRAQHQLVDVDERVPPDPEMAKLVQHYSERLSKELEVPIGETTVPLDARNVTVRQQESNLGNFIADVMRAAVGADVAITNGGGIRTNALFPAGRITRKDVLAWLPFGNVVVKVAVTGAVIRQALENGVSQWEQVAGRFPQVSGLRYTFNPTRPVGSRILEVRVGDRALDEAATYTVATNDFMLRGGDGYAMLATGQVLVSPVDGPVMANAVMEAIQRLRTISPRVEGRITLVR
ncbi:MAG: 5'-nucleotidase C-terminal domain-containing protein [Armatimonadota bacterium]|nr:5'-nucleotidase C-terminal domain-containing protein [Armatimonadota bacterium]MDR5690116.1 5'-nucleotidase C-terminal domain-containing protein [Armatimonadota bacterium]MDR7462338.1 5'-nucleotidase C-terminal domain-containing protein [Armatimonadota bacterium]MDR7476985.1 5'-nucleotidase C-terminal domain-containing protein [Armatimonadota bacterium]MDR7525372.1 5'-nucleotidase C-terminal domain-containing protein [Armatimonadota bacterium]